MSKHDDCIAESNMSEADYARNDDLCRKLIESRKEDKPVWKCKDGRELTADKMGLAHIINSLWMLKNNGFSAEEMEFIWYDSEHTGEYAALSLDDHNMRAGMNKYSPWFDIFHNELISRGFTMEQIQSWMYDY